MILAVPFALTGGVFLQYLLGYNFSVAVWVGYIALFGTAIQTGVVMVVYLEEAVAKRRLELGAAFTRDDLVQAIKDGARLRLRPKVMTVATIVASLLPIMWSTQTGSEVMQPLAAPVIGGMVSSLLHILVVTPVIFAWLREGRCGGRRRRRGRAALRAAVQSSGWARGDWLGRWFAGGRGGQKKVRDAHNASLPRYGATRLFQAGEVFDEVADFLAAEGEAEFLGHAGHGAVAGFDFGFLDFHQAVLGELRTSSASVSLWTMPAKLRPSFKTMVAFS